MESLLLNKMDTSQLASNFSTLCSTLEMDPEFVSLFLSHASKQPTTWQDQFMQEINRNIVEFNVKIETRFNQLEKDLAFLKDDKIDTICNQTESDLAIHKANIQLSDLNTIIDPKSLVNRINSVSEFPGSLVLHKVSAQQSDLFTINTQDSLDDKMDTRLNQIDMDLTNHAANFQRCDLYTINDQISLVD